MNIVFFGNTKHSQIVERILFDTFGLAAVVTTPDRIVGRKQLLTPTPTKTFALQQGIPVIEADKLDKTITAAIRAYKPDFLIVSDYGLFLPNDLLTLPKYAALNVHHSLLPLYRGPTPAPAAILNGDRETGVTIITMAEAIDAGDILAQKTYPMEGTETTDALLDTLNTLGGQLLCEVIEQYTKGTQQPIPQDENQVSFTTHLTKQSGYIDLVSPPTKESIDRMIRAYYPWPGVWTKGKMKGQEIRIKFLPENKLQLEGGKPMSSKDFLNGYPEMKELIEKLLP